jgi:TRAP-type transport system periplasmic protein
VDSPKAILLTVLSLVVVSCAATTTAPPQETTSTASIGAEGTTPLRLAITGGFAEAQFVHFRDTLAEISGDALGIEYADEWDIASTDADVEQQIVRAVASGDIDLGWVGSRAFAELGVTSFDALTAPFLIDSYELEDAVLGSDIPERMLAGLDQVGGTGLAVIGGGLRKPIAVAAPLRSPDDFTGLTIHGWRSHGNAAAIKALGGVYTGVAGGERDAGLEEGTIDGFENTIGFFENKLRLVNYMTANAVFWPATGVLIANTDRLAGLSDTEREWLDQAVSDTVNESTALVNIDTDLIDEICTRGGRFALASQADLEALHEAVQPVYANLAQNTETAGFIREIEVLKAEMPIEWPSIADDCLAK